MAVKKYPIGTKIRYIGLCAYSSREDFTGMTGTIVGIVTGFPLVYLPKAVHISEHSTIERPATIQTGWNRIERLTQKGEQLLFSFMEQEDEC